jgi:hypothetical protein
MSKSSDYRSLISRGRKAGLTTRELYSAMAARPIDGHAQILGRVDGNGYVFMIDQEGHRVYRPLDGPSMRS